MGCEKGIQRARLSLQSVLLDPVLTLSSNPILSLLIYPVTPHSLFLVTYPSSIKYLSILINDPFIYRGFESDRVSLLVRFFEVVDPLNVFQVWSFWTEFGYNSRGDLVFFAVMVKKHKCWSEVKSDSRSRWSKCYDFTCVKIRSKMAFFQIW
jgi:hypothetical protein